MCIRDSSDTGRLRNCFGILGQNRHADIIRAEHGEYGKSPLGADAVDGDEETEHVQVIPCKKSVQLKGILPDAGIGMYFYLFPDSRKAGMEAGGNFYIKTDMVDLQDQVIF